MVKYAFVSFLSNYSVYLFNT